jgi:translation initiation factor IF-1
MSKADDYIKMQGTVVEVLPSAKFKIKLESNNVEILGHVSGRMRKNNIRVLLGDTVTIEISAYDLSKGRIVQRH